MSGRYICPGGLKKNVVIVDSYINTFLCFDIKLVFSNKVHVLYRPGFH